MDIKRKLENIVWHIETNREILGDKRTLDDVWNALKIMVEKLKNENE
ncbi:hypothetical protein ACFVXR_17460 [Bacillus thuringiensis]|nr:hypothetical protein [Bacillus thuringiensis]